MTDLVERYLAAIARELPESQRKDIIAELRDDLLSRIERKEDSAGGPLDRVSLEAVLLGFGHPLIVAGRYRTVQHLIGPEMFPLWWVAMKWSLGVVVGVYVVLLVLAIGFDVDELPARSALPDLFTSLLITFGAVTGIAVLAERSGQHRWVYRWRPRDLPSHSVWAPKPFDRVVEIGLAIVFILWWVGAIGFRQFIPAGVFQVALAPVFEFWFWPILAYSAFEIVVNLVGLIRPGRAVLNTALTLARSLAVVAICGGLLQAGHWLVVSSDALAGPALDLAQARFDRGFRVGLITVAACMSAKAGLDAWRLRRALKD
jgi:hypothetical protein